MTNLHDVPKPEFSFRRLLAQWIPFYRYKLERTGLYASEVLQGIYSLLPKDGRSFTNRVQGLAERVALADAEGMSREDIVANLCTNFAMRGIPWWVEAGYEKQSLLLQSLYNSVLGRPIDTRGRLDYERRLMQGSPLGNIRSEVVLSQEFTDQITQVEQTQGRARAIEVLYERVLGRRIDGAGREFYISSGRSLQEVRQELLNSEEYTNRFV